mmetsp:Transcript_15988/g.46915  ORF Transcript_15988/g.46915 Transcript_15988/m.46915 type:complete len:87 (+) Transcript_15988:30-290(+)|eukprot:CAMPEP_0118973508 /NCGR_PEP_ID=MMETSP1173-20130426/10319_1 /TAXON_ID=1034831 /ORGANISM="Rhizochromulina marina cf, Strain CCMP1243" /LENGTH=86 /DNA_ID=CAMNT_0006923181 /DNA_START=35 /DNA_END=295 /DNA_ORIENTATION=+
MARFSVFAVLLALVASATAFVAPAPRMWGTRLQASQNQPGEEPKIGAGGMADTRDPDEMTHEDPRKSISAAPSFEEYLKQRQAEGN